MYQSRLVFALLLLLPGCAAIQQKQLAAEMNGIVDRCKANMLATRGAVTISDKTAPADARDITPSMIANRSLPTPADIAAISELEPIQHQCRSEALAFLQKNAPLAVPVIEASYVNSTEATGIFEQGQMPWGDYNRFKLENYKLTLQALQQTEMQAAVVNAAQRQAAAAESANLIQALQGLSASLRAAQPVVTNCSQAGQFTNCVTR